jgi:hypothetical protein
MYVKYALWHVDNAVKMILITDLRMMKSNINVNAFLGMKEIKHGYVARSFAMDPLLKTGQLVIIVHRHVVSVLGLCQSDLMILVFPWIIITKSGLVGRSGG